MVVQRTVKLDEELYRRLRIRAIEQEKKVYECLNSAIAEWLETGKEKVGAKEKETKNR